MRAYAQFLTDLEPCPYLHDRPSRLDVRLAVDITPEQHAAELAAGVRHFGRSYFRPACPRCTECVSMRIPVQRIYDVGVAGLHRILNKTPQLREAAAVVVVAGMEGALPSVVGGLVSSPVFAVPTSVGYGASFHGLAALLAMLNSCAPGVTVSNIDNGLSAGIAAARVVRVVEGVSSPPHHS